MAKKKVSTREGIEEGLEGELKRSNPPQEGALSVPVEVPQHYNDVFHFAVIADPQLNNGSCSVHSNESPPFEFVVQTMNRLRPPFLVILGDMTHRPDNEVQLAEYRRILGLLDPFIQVMHVAGNHDCHNQSLVDHHISGPTPRLIDWYRRTYGPDYYTFRYRSVFGIVVNSSYFRLETENVKTERAEHEKWLLRTLKEAQESGADHILVFQHFPFFLNDVAESDGYRNVPRRMRERMLDLYGEHGVKAVHSGHIHCNLNREANGIRLVSTSTCGSILLGDDPHGIRLVYVRGDEIEDEFLSLGNLPWQVPLFGDKGERL